MIPISRTRRSNPKPRSRSTSRTPPPQSSTNTKKPTGPSPIISFINPFCDSPNARLTKAEYVSPSTTPSLSSLQIKVRSMPKTGYDISPSTRPSESSGPPFEQGQRQPVYTEGSKTGAIPRPRRLSKEELRSPLLNGRFVLSTIKTEDGTSILRRSLDLGLGLGRSASAQSSKGREKEKEGEMTRVELDITAVNLK
ncbi:hypothetical protein I302_103331 [Kwoniella bestiolae CBS 10118]|uniref:Uncharacterized protein n=1 Tax=Kwoniella bestiolae CBS 10118 TaxID=1296100 RepID=A0A1B9G835_9TREE|nr:hypothetical protein I302_02033 [Kwoniella bestiolae CBS 10118]OCF27195.1 hypothetical protein I302_02033 [Kwoniella bestiolae CBS 10118]